MRQFHGSVLHKERGGTRSPSLGMLAWKLLIWSEKRNISLTAEHIPLPVNEM
jgi:hypothetical protein